MTGRPPVARQPLRSRVESRRMKAEALRPDRRAVAIVRLPRGRRAASAGPRPERWLDRHDEARSPHGARPIRRRRPRRHRPGSRASPRPRHDAGRRDPSRRRAGRRSRPGSMRPRALAPAGSSPGSDDDGDSTHRLAVRREQWLTIDPPISRHVAARRPRRPARAARRRVGRSGPHVAAAPACRVRCLDRRRRRAALVVGSTAGRVTAARRAHDRPAPRLPRSMHVIAPVEPAMTAVSRVARWRGRSRRPIASLGRSAAVVGQADRRTTPRPAARQSGPRAQPTAPATERVGHRLEARRPSVDGDLVAPTCSGRRRAGSRLRLRCRRSRPGRRDVRVEPSLRAQAESSTTPARDGGAR